MSVEIFTNDTPTAIDLETTGLDWRNDRIMDMAWARGDHAVYEVAPSIEQVLIEHEGPYVLHNGKFDLHFLKSAGIAIQGFIHDTMIMSYLLKPVRAGGHSLGAIARSILGVQHVEIADLLGKGKKKRAITDIPIEELAEKSKEDVRHTYALFEAFKSQMPSDLWQLYIDLELPLLHNLLQDEIRGVIVDVNFLKQLRDQLEKQEREAKEGLSKHSDINYASPKQLGRLLFDTLGLPITRRTKTGQASTDEETMQVLENRHPVPRLILQARRAHKLTSTWIDPLIDAGEEGKGVVHLNYNQYMAG